MGNGFSRFRRGFQRFLQSVVLTLMISLTSVVVVGVVFRKAGSSLVWYDEVASILLAWLTYYGACLAALKRTHIGFPKLIQSVRPTLRRNLIVIRETVVVGFFLLTGWTGWQVLQVLEGDYLVSLPWVPMRLTQSVIPVGAALFVIAELLSLTQTPEQPGSTERPAREVQAS